MQTSYGGMTEVFAFLTAQEQTELQGLSRYFRDVAVSRIQTRFRLPAKTMMILPHNGPLERTVLEVTGGKAQIVTRHTN